MNGFDTKDCDDIANEEPKEEPIPEPTPEPTPKHEPEEPEITENFIKRFFRALIDLIKKWLNL